MPYDSREAEDNFGSNDSSVINKLESQLKGQGAQLLVRDMIRIIGDDPNREGLRETPGRVVHAWMEMFSGYRQKPEELIKTFTETGKYDQMVLCVDIPFTSFCEHHILPFTGLAHVGYLPNGKVIGLSKIPRLVDVFAKRLQIQERLTTDIAQALMDHLAPRGVGVIISAHHSCVSCRGVNKTAVKMVTSSLQGVFRTDSSTRAEFLNLVGARLP